jgi:YbbR domain-containing protein
MRLRPRYPTLFVGALVVAIFLWYSLALPRREKISEKQVSVPLTLVNIPADQVITGDYPRTVTARLRGPLSRIRAAESENALEAVLDLAGATPGLRTYPVTQSQLLVPQELEDIELVSFDPSEITLQIERRETLSLPVVATIEGEPAEGYEVTQINVSPQRVTVQGPGSLLVELEEITTTPVSIEGQTTTLETMAQPRLTHPLLRVLQPGPLVVTVGISPAPTPTPIPDSDPS